MLQKPLGADSRLFPKADRSPVQAEAQSQLVGHAVDGATTVDLEHLEAIAGGIAGDLVGEDAVAFQQMDKARSGSVARIQNASG